MTHTAGAYPSVFQRWNYNSSIQGQRKISFVNQKLSRNNSYLSPCKSLLSQHITPMLEAAGIPQVTQTAYREGVSCTDSMFASMEACAHLRSNGDHVYSCFYDLASAFDTVEFCVLLQNLFQAGVRGKCWRLLRNWYSNLTSQVRLGSHISKPFSICRGIRQGSVLSPVLFNLIMDPLLSTLSSRSLDISINALFSQTFRPCG